MLNQRFITNFLEKFDESKHERMLEIYMTSLKNHANVCREALSEKEKLGDLQASTHDLKSIFRTLGAQAQGDLAEKIETSIKEGTTEQLAEDTNILLKDIDETLALMEAML